MNDVIKTIWLGVVAILAFAVLFATARAAEPLQPENLRAEYYDTVDIAGATALQLSVNKSQTYEYGGLILITTNGKFRITEPRTNYSGDRVFVGDTEDVDYAGYYVVADYHTHPCLPYTHFSGVFSDGDINSNQRTMTIGYMAELCYGRILRYVPGVTAADFVFNRERPEDIGSRGELIGHVDLGHDAGMSLERSNGRGVLRGNIP